MKVNSSYFLPISQKGQITIPVNVRRLLNLDKQKKVVLQILDNKKVIFTTPGLSLKEVYGSVKPIRKPFSQIREIARQERAARAK